MPDRTAETFAQWLREHPGVELISRDRGGAYAEGGALGAPNAIQVADRWHLLKNLGDALISLFDQHRPAIEQHLRLSTVLTIPTQNLRDAAVSSLSGAPTNACDGALHTQPDQDASMAPIIAAVKQAETQSAVQPAPTPSHSLLSKRKQEEQERRRQQRRARYEEVCKLRSQGYTLNAIADKVGFDRNTVRKWVRAPAFPERQPRTPQSGLLDPFKPSILELWNAGCHTGTALLREAKARGYHGSRTLFFAYITQLRNASGLPPKKRKGVQAKPICDPTQRVPSSRGSAALILSKPDALDETDKERLSRLQDAHADIATAINLAHEFATIVRRRQSDQLDGWLERTERTGIAPLVSFVKGIRRDYDAVKAGVTLAYNNGPTEGHINRLKMLKRQMFGRAKLDLLEKRMMAN